MVICNPQSMTETKRCFNNCEIFHALYVSVCAQMTVFDRVFSDKRINKTPTERTFD